MKTTEQAPTGGGGIAKLKRACNQVNNARRLILSLPKQYYLKDEKLIEEINLELKKIDQKINKLSAS